MWQPFLAAETEMEMSSVLPFRAVAQRLRIGEIEYAAKSKIYKRRNY